MCINCNIFVRKMSRPTKIRRLSRPNWKCYVKKGDHVVFLHHGCNYIGKVNRVTLRIITENYKHMVAVVEGNFVSHMGYDFLIRAPEESIMLHNKAYVNDTFVCSKSVDDKIVLLNTDSTVHKNILNWRENIVPNQQLWYRSPKDLRMKLKCVVKFINGNTVTMQPQNCRRLIHVAKNSATIHPVIQRSQHNLWLSHAPNYIFQNTVSLRKVKADKYIGCECSLKESPALYGYLIDVDYDDKDNDIYCWCNSDVNSLLLDDLANTRRHTVFKWVRIQDVAQIKSINNILSTRWENQNEISKVVRVKADVEFSEYDKCKLRNLLHNNDLQLVYYYLTNHFRHYVSNSAMFALSQHNYTKGYLSKFAYDFKKDPNLSAFMRMMLAKQQYYTLNNMENELLKSRIQCKSFYFDASNLNRSYMRQILKLEREDLATQLFTIRPINIEINSYNITMDLEMKINRVYTTDLHSYLGSALTIHKIITKPLMDTFLNIRLPRYERLENFFSLRYYKKKKTSEFFSSQCCKMKKKIKSLKPYQKHIASKMVAEENNKDALSNFFCHSVQNIEYNELTGLRDSTTYRSNGGILCLDTGWGKTVTMIEVILQNPCSTLIVAPLTLLDQWKMELQNFAPDMSVCEFYGKNKKEDASVVLTTYDTLRYASVKEYERVVFDEAHLIKNRTSLRAQACTIIKAKYRWCITATPFDDNFNYFQTLLGILGIRPFSDYNTQLVSNSCYFQPLLDRIFFTLDKSMMREKNLHPITKEVKKHTVVKIKLQEDVITLVNEFKKEARRRMQQTSVYMSVLKPAATQMQVICTDPTAFPLSLFSKLDTENNAEITRDDLIKDLQEDKSQYKNNLALILQKNSDNMCNICLDEYTTPCITPCMHIFCQTCINQSLNHKKSCPNCRQPVSKDKLKKLVEDKKKSKSVGDLHYFTDALGCNYVVSNKIKEIYEKLKKETPTKFLKIKSMLSKNDGQCVIFSQYSLPLRRLHKFLDANGIESALISGQTRRNKRAEYIKMFSSGKIKVCLLSTRTAGVGLNLQKGSNIIFLEPILCKNERIQSIGRLRRIGQENDIFTQTLCAQNTYEESILSFMKSQRQIRRQYRRREGTRDKKSEKLFKHKLYDHILS